ncbi:MAG: phosphotransferase [Candidatus Aureabacteria bacterium]|nr:phosphotransferase [Candidatus Auribacterota bacterium]
MLLEIHGHSSKHSTCSSAPPLELVRQARAKALQGIIITEHHYLWSDEELLTLRREAEVENHFLILAGQEVETDVGHLLVYGASRSIEGGLPVAELRKRHPEAALVLAHPYRDGREVQPELLMGPCLDGVEIFSGNHSVRENCRGLRDWHRFKFTATGGTDIHAKRQGDLYPTQFDHPVRDIGGVAAEIKAGRCRPFFKEIPKSGASLEVTEITIGTKGEDELRPRIIFRKYDSRQKWEKAERAFGIMKEIYRHGFDAGPFRVPTPIDREPETLTLIEQGLRGKSLFEKLKLAGPAGGREFVELSARWLARLHNLRLRVTPLEKCMEEEPARLERYVKHFSQIKHAMTEAAGRIMDEVRARGLRIIASSPESVVQCHGDYHPKNIFIGQDMAEDGTTQFVSAIDFESSHIAPRAFDAGCFLAQYENQLYPIPRLLESCPGEIFLQAYLGASENLPGEFLSQVSVYRARADLSIASYLIAVGKGESDDLKRVMRDAEKALSAA